MIQVSDKGYTPSTPSEIREELLEKCKAEIIGFEERPADLNNNLIELPLWSITGYEPYNSNDFVRLGSL